MRIKTIGGLGLLKPEEDANKKLIVPGSDVSSDFTALVAVIATISTPRIKLSILGGGGEGCLYSLMLILCLKSSQKPGLHKSIYCSAINFTDFELQFD